MRKCFLFLIISFTTTTFAQQNSSYFEIIQEEEKRSEDSSQECEPCSKGNSFLFNSILWLPTALVLYVGSAALSYKFFGVPSSSGETGDAHMLINDYNTRPSCHTCGYSVVQ
jgi:hypothetical protein